MAHTSRRLRWGSMHGVPNGYGPHNGAGVGCPVSLGVLLAAGAASAG